MTASDYTFATEEGRRHLLHSWQELTQGTINLKESTEGERAFKMTEWLRWCIKEKALDPQKRLPPYKEIGILFEVKEKWVTASIQQLRKEKLLPKRKTRKDKDKPQWNERDLYLWEYIGSMRAIRFDQARRLLARESEDDIENGLLSISRTSEIIKRWTDARYAVFLPVFAKQPGWIWMSRRGLNQVELPFRAEAPSIRTLEHLYWINEVRMRLEDQYDEDEMEWTSEREIQAEQSLRQKGQSIIRIPDGIAHLPRKNGKREHIDIEVQISKTSQDEVERVMADIFYTKSTNALRYYVNKRSRGVVRTALKEVEQRTSRPSIEIIDVRTCKPL